MTREQRRALLGDTVIAQIHERVAQAPPPPPEVIDRLRRILAPAAARVASQKASAAEAA
jgi:hypothetical protein